MSVVQARYIQGMLGPARCRLCQLGVRRRAGRVQGAVDGRFVDVSSSSSSVASLDIAAAALFSNGSTSGRPSSP